MLKMKDIEIIHKGFHKCLSNEGIRQYLIEAAAYNSQEAGSDRTVMVWTVLMCRHHFPVCSLVVKSMLCPAPARMTIVAKIYNIEIVEEL